MILTQDFFDRDAQEVAKDLLGKVLRKRHAENWLSAMIIETESYYLTDKGSHASLGYTKKRAALFMPAGTIYMYYARGKDSMNVSCHGDGNAVLLKSGKPYLDAQGSAAMLLLMQQLNPNNQLSPRTIAKLCSGQTLLCKSLGLKVTDWDQQGFDPEQLYIEDIGYRPERIIQTTRLGIPKGRDEHLLYRFIDYKYAADCTSNPLTKRNWQEGKDYLVIAQDAVINPQET